MCEIELSTRESARMELGFGVESPRVEYPRVDNKTGIGNKDKELGKLQFRSMSSLLDICGEDRYRL